MSLSNNYVGETEKIAGQPILYSRLWIHRFANRRNLAYTDDEAVELGKKLKEKFGDRKLADEEMLELLDSQELNLSGALGRYLEEDEEDHLKEHPRDVVIDL